MQTQFTIFNGQIVEKEAIRELFTLPDGKYLIDKPKSIKKRSLLQNAYYWSVIVPMVKDGLRETGYNEVKTNEDAHTIIKHLFLKKKIKSEKTGDEIEIEGSTAKLKTYEFNSFIDEVIMWAASYLSITIPLPGDQMIMFTLYDKDVSATIVEKPKRKIIL